jgi:hypothetical protein
LLLNPTGNVIVHGKRKVDQSKPKKKEERSNTLLPPPDRHMPLLTLVLLGKSLLSYLRKYSSSEFNQSAIRLLVKQNNQDDQYHRQWYQYDNHRQ